jgi:hypothetical protein
VQALGGATLKTIVRLGESECRNLTVDRTVREDVWGRARVRESRVSSAVEAQRVHEVGEILSNRRLLRHPRRRKVEEASRPVAAEIRDQDSASGRRRS